MAPSTNPTIITNNNHLPPSLRPQTLWTHPLFFTLSWTAVIVTLPLVVPVLLSLYLYRLTVRLLARYNGSLSSPLTPYDCIFAVDSYYTRPYASNLTVLDMKSRVSLAQVRRLFRSRVLDDSSFSKLHYIPVEFLGYWFWKQIRVEDDGVEVYYDSELELEGGEKHIDDCLQEIIEMPFKDKLFNVLVLHFGNKSYVVFRIHHTVCDGYSFNHLIDRFVGLESKYLVKREAKTLKRMFREVYTGAGKWALLLLHLPMHIISLFKESVNHSPNHYTLPKRSTRGLIRRSLVPLHHMKQIRRATNSHFASVGMSLMTGALQRYYDEQRGSSLLRPTRLSIMHSLPKPNHPLNTLCNHWGVGLFKIPFVSDPLLRMKGAEDDFEEYTRLGYDDVLHIHIPVVGLLPCWVVKWFFSINFGTSCGFTSVPGLFDRVAWVGGGQEGSSGGGDGLSGGDAQGVEVAHMWKVFGLQWRQSAVAVAMYTYRGEASISFYANSDIIPDARSMDRLIQLFHDDFNVLLNNCASSKAEDSSNEHRDKVSSKTSPENNGSVIARSFKLA